jgi:hypothetical protein
MGVMLQVMNEDLTSVQTTIEILYGCVLERYEWLRGSLAMSRGGINPPNPRSSPRGGHHADIPMAGS